MFGGSQCGRYATARVAPSWCPRAHGYAPAVPVRPRGCVAHPHPEAMVVGIGAPSVRQSSHETRSASSVIADHPPKPITILAHAVSSRTSDSTRTTRASGGACASHVTQRRQQPTSPEDSGNSTRQVVLSVWTPGGDPLDPQSPVPPGRVKIRQQGSKNPEIAGQGRTRKTPLGHRAQGW